MGGRRCQQKERDPFRYNSPQEIQAGGCNEQEGHKAHGVQHEDAVIEERRRPPEQEQQGYEGKGDWDEEKGEFVGGLLDLVEGVFRVLELLQNCLVELWVSGLDRDVPVLRSFLNRLHQGRLIGLVFGLG